jgi:hypothetical protein
VAVSLSEPEQLKPKTTEIKHKYRTGGFYLSRELNVKAERIVYIPELSVFVVEIYMA